MAKAKKNPFPFGNPKLEKKEEKVKKDLDGDGEKGEPAAHRKKVLGGSGAKAAPPFMKGGGKSGGKPFPPAKKK